MVTVRDEDKAWEVEDGGGGEDNTGYTSTEGVEWVLYKQSTPPHNNLDGGNVQRTLQTPTHAGTRTFSAERGKPTPFRVNGCHHCLVQRGSRR